MNTALERGIIDVTQINEYQLDVIANIILSGYKQSDDNLYNLAKEISNHKKE